MSKIIVITGMDGCGKSTIIEQLQSETPNAVVVDIWQAMTNHNELFDKKRAVDAYICSLTPFSRTLFLAHALMESINKALETKAAIIFVNAYYFKYFASEIALGTNVNELLKLIQLFPKADFTIKLTASLEEIVQRKKSFSRYECGGVLNPNEKAFIAFQTRCSDQWAFFENEIDCHINNSASIDSVLQEVKDKITTFLR